MSFVYPTCFILFRSVSFNLDFAPRKSLRDKACRLDVVRRCGELSGPELERYDVTKSTPKKHTVTVSIPHSNGFVGFIAAYVGPCLVFLGPRGSYVASFWAV